MELSLLGDKIEASDAQKIGIVNYVTKEGELGSETDALTSRLANGPTRVYARTKRLLYSSLKTNSKANCKTKLQVFQNAQSSLISEKG